MTSLLPDDSYCTSELGKLLFQSKSDWAGRAYVVEAKETAQIGVKFIEYTILIVMTPRQSLDLDERSFVLLSRFRNLNRLHSSLRKLHQQLYLKSPFPSFPEAKWIGGNDAATTNERKAATETFLSFILTQDVLRKSRLLHQFIESAEEKVAEGHLVDASTVITSGTTLLDLPDTISADVVPVISPDNGSDSPSSNDFQIDDISIESALSMQRGGKGFLTEYLYKLTKKNEEPDESYLVLAGRLVSTAQIAETDGAYETAFYSYKEAANILIKGMESEKSLSTRNAVRLKSAKFIERAEVIYRNYLRYDNAPLFDMGNMIKPDHDEFAFRSSNSALKAFRFIGVLPDVEAKKRVFLVEEIDTGRQYVMKLIERRDEEGEDRIFLPTNVPHMVPLIKFFTTSNYAILLLQYVKTGRLWSFLCRYLAESEKRFDNSMKNEANEDFVESFDEMNGNENPYRGRHTRFSVSADCERLARIENEALEEASSALVCTMGEDAAERDERPEMAKYILVPSDTPIENTSIVIEEEAPAPVVINTIRNEGGEDGGMMKRKKSSNDSSSKDNRFIPLSEAIAKCRLHLRESKRCWSGTLPESLIVHWSAQCISMLYVLHSHQVYIGDLHPDNLLIDEEGNLLFTYHARWHKECRDREFLSGYSAPECHTHSRELSSSCDVWSLGALLYELLVGRPLSAAAPHGIGRVSEVPLIMDSSLISYSARDLLSRMLQVDAEDRPTIDQVRAHPFYSSIDWLLYDNPHGPARMSTVSVDESIKREEDTVDEEKKTMNEVEEKEEEKNEDIESKDCIEEERIDDNNVIEEDEREKMVNESEVIEEEGEGSIVFPTVPNDPPQRIDTVDNSSNQETKDHN